MRQLKITKRITERGQESIDTYLSEISKYDLLSPLEEEELARKARQGDEEAYNKLVCCNLRFVVSVAKQFQHQGMPLADMINEGNIGLMKAAEKFDETKGFKFISYAVWWIRQSILSALAQKSRTIRLPQNQVGLLGRIHKTIATYEQEHGQFPTLATLAELVGEDADKVESVMNTDSRMFSMDAPFTADGENEGNMGDVLSADIPATDHHLDRESLSRELDRYLKSVLKQTEEEILRRCFGVGREESSLDEISLDMHLSRERVRQIREKSLRKLREGGKSNLLRSFLG